MRVTLQRAGRTCGVDYADLTARFRLCHCAERPDLPVHEARLGRVPAGRGCVTRAARCGAARLLRGADCQPETQLGRSSKLLCALKRILNCSTHAWREARARLALSFAQFETAPGKRRLRWPSALCPLRRQLCVQRRYMHRLRSSQVVQSLHPRDSRGKPARRGWRPMCSQEWAAGSWPCAAALVRTPGQRSGHNVNGTALRAGIMRAAHGCVCAAHARCGAATCSMATALQRPAGNASAMVLRQLEVAQAAVQTQ